MAKKKVVVKRRGNTSRNNKKDSSKYTKEFNDKELDLFDTELDDIEPGDGHAKNAYYSSSDTGEEKNSEKLARLEKKLKKARKNQNKQKHFVELIILFCLNYLNEILIAILISVFSFVMLLYVPKIVEYNPSYEDISGIISAAIIALWIIIIIIDFALSAHRKKKER